MPVSQDPNGFTVVTPSGDSRLVYVSNSLGDDANDGLSEGNPVQTIAAGKALMRDGFPDHMLLRRGDTWTDEALGQWTTSGRNTDEPQYISTYGTGDRPVLRVTVGPVLAAPQASGNTSNVVFQSLNFYAYRHDPDSPDYTGQNPGNAVNWLQSGDSILLEDLFIKSFSTGLSIQNRDSVATSTNFAMRRCIVVDSYDATGANSHGLYMYGMVDVLFEDNVFDTNGWINDRDDPVTGASFFHHNLYLQNTNTNITFRGNISVNASLTGCQFRSGGLMEDNCFMRNPLGTNIGYSLGPVGGIAVTIRRNVILEGNDVNSSTIRGTGMVLQNTNFADVRENIVSNVLSIPSNNYGMQIEAEASVPASGISLNDNKFWNWRFGGPWRSAASAPYVTIVEEENNYYYEYSPITGSNQDSATTDWNDPNRVAATYNASLGGTGTFDAFMAEVRQQSRTNWRPEYTAYAINDYIRTGLSVGGEITGTGTFSADAQGAVVTTRLASATATFEADASGAVEAVRSASATGVMTADAQGRVGELREPAATGVFAADAAGVVQSTATIAATGEFSASATGDFIGDRPASGVGIFSDDAAGAVSVVPLLEPTATGTFLVSAQGTINQTGVVVPTGSGLFSANALGSVNSQLIISPSGVGLFSADAAGLIISTKLGVATGTFTADALGSFDVPPTAAIARRVAIIPKENRFIEV